MSEPRPIRLDYVSPRDGGPPFNWPRAIWLTIATCVPPIACYVWALIRCRWLVRQPWFQSGSPIETIYYPIFIVRPLAIGTAWIGLVALFVLAMVMWRKWSRGWLRALPIAFVVLVYFFWMMELGLGETYFP